MLLVLAEIVFNLVLVAGPAAAGKGALECGRSGVEWREAPSIRAPSPELCRSRYRDWSPVALLALSPDQEKLRRGLSRLDGLEVLAAEMDGDARGTSTLMFALPGPNHFVLAPTKGNNQNAEERMFRRLVQMASADVVILTRQGEEVLVTDASVEAAIQHFRSNPNLAVLGMRGGWHGNGDCISSPGRLQNVHVIASGPLAVRRSAFLEVEMLPGGGHSVHEFSSASQSTAVKVSLSARAANWQVGIQTFDNNDSCREAAENGEDTPKPYFHTSNSSPSTSTTSCQDSVARGAVVASIIIQYFRRPQNIRRIVNGIRATCKGLRIEVLVNDDSRTDVSAWLRELRGMDATLVLAPNVHEIRAYNRLAKLSAGSVLVFAQDDDAPSVRGWLQQGIRLLASHPELGLLGGYRGRMDYGKVMDPHYHYINGPKYGAAPADGPRIGTCCWQLPTISPATRSPFMYIYKVSMGPILAPRASFLASGMFHTNFSCPGEPGIGFDYEYSIRMWHSGRKVGLYSAGFDVAFGSKDSGTRTSARSFAARRRTELRNNGLLYDLYSGFHHGRGNAVAAAAWRFLHPRPGLSRSKPTDRVGTADFIRFTLANRLRKAVKTGKANEARDTAELMARAARSIGMSIPAEAALHLRHAHRFRPGAGRTTAVRRGGTA